MSELAISNELNSIIKNYETPVLILPEDQGSTGLDATQSGALNYSQRRVIRVAEFYSNSRYLISQRDELGREKPFYNIVNAICDIEDAAKDFDTKNVQATADDEHYVESFLLTKDIYQWMKEVRLGVQINRSKQLHTRYGGVLAKKVEKEIAGEKTIFVEFPEWKNVINDQIEIEDQPIVEKHFMTRSQLFEKRDVWNEDKIKQAIKEMPKGSKSLNRFAVYEIRGTFPRSVYKEAAGEGTYDPEDTDFSYQYHVLIEVSSKKKFSLYAEDDTEKVYKFLARKPKAGRALGVGVVEENEQAQVWINDTVQKQQRAYEHSTRVVAQSASKKLKSRNVLTEYDDGQIIEIEDGKPIEAVPLVPPGGMAQFNQMIEQWWTQAQRISSAYDAQSGEKPAAGTAFRLQALNLQQSSSVFAGLQEDLAMLWEDIFNDWIMPYLAKKINKAHILAHQFSADELNEIDKSFAAFTANQKLIEKALHPDFTLPSTPPLSQDDHTQAMQDAKAQISATKDTRFLQIPKDYYKDVDSKITINISGESKDKQQTLDSLKAIMDIYAKNPALAQSPILTKLFLEIVEQSNTGISPVSLMSAINAQAQQMQDQAKQQMKVGESINFKDLPPEGQQQMAAQAGIQLQAPQQAQAPQAQPQGVSQ